MRRLLRAPSVRVSVLTLNAPRKAYLGLAVDRAQVAAIVAVARLRRVGIVVLQESYAGQKRAWRRRPGWQLVDATPNSAGERGNAIAVRRRVGRITFADELTGQGPDGPLHFPVATVELLPATPRQRHLAARGYRFPVVDVAGFHFPRKPAAARRYRVELARIVARVMAGELPAIVAGDANDRSLFVELGARWLVRAGVDGVGFSRHFRRPSGKLLRGRLRRVTDHPGDVIGRARIELSRP